MDAFVGNLTLIKYIGGGGGGSVQGVFMTPPVGKYKTSYIMADFQVLGAELIINNYDKIWNPIGGK